MTHVGALAVLPPRLLDRIFFQLDAIRDLASFIVTARLVYRHFRAWRRTILVRVLQNELGPAFPDARFLFVFPYSNPADRVRYHDWIYVMAGGGDPGLLTLGELTKLCQTLHLINSMTDIYITAQLASFALHGGGGTPATAPVSRRERRRVVRAFYRRQIVSNAWALTRRPPCFSVHDSNAFCNTANTSTEHGQSLGLLAAFEPWDMQQIDHANIFIRGLCCALVHRAAEVAEAPGGGRRISARQFGHLYAHLNHLVRYLRAHRGVAAAAVGDVQWGRWLPDGQRPHVKFASRYQLLPLLGAWQKNWSLSFPDPILDKQVRDGLLMDDFVADGPDQVPFGWWDALRGRYVRWYGEGLIHIPALLSWENRERRLGMIDLWRGAGFALWDRKRVEALKRLRRFEALQTGWALDCAE
ncbi:hypothetical protein BT67DRAFT_449731 [Trichocladium antarcticum]|uniref:Uncharacterized protein n=1 Tax=Trichocladium antarcticum TaxID=1450529 RepID=A0AAN6ULX3_9PEZI|nr:hypothetical protein BT67DRAFT_449731 [Trichocladium antarcticum]